MRKYHDQYNCMPAFPMDLDSEMIMFDSPKNIPVPSSRVEVPSRNICPRTPNVSPRTPRPLMRKHSKNKQCFEPHDAGTGLKNDELISDLLRNINNDQIMLLKQEFEARGGSVSLVQFIHIIHKVLNVEYEFSVVNRIVDLFSEIDIDGDEDMTFEEFTSYIVANGIKERKPLRQYEEVELRIPEGNSFPGLTKITYIKHIDMVVICHKNPENAAKIFRPITGPRQPKLQLVRKIRGHKGLVLCSHFLPGRNLLVTTGIDNRMLFWDYHHNFRLRNELPTRRPIISLEHSLDFPHLLFAASTTGYVMCYTLDPGSNTDNASSDTLLPSSPGISRPTTVDSEVETSPIDLEPISLPTTDGLLLWEHKAHESMVPSLKHLKNTSNLISVGLDAKIYIWDIHAAKITRSFVGHIKGVFDIAYHTDLRLVITAGSDRDALIWNPWAPFSHSIGRLQGHHVSLVGVEVVDNSPQAITSDIQGIFRLWDLRTFRCIQQFSSTLSPSSPHDITTFSFLSAHSQILAGGERLVTFQYDKPSNAWLTEDRTIVAALHNSHSNTILTAAGNNVRIWCAKEGVVLKSFETIFDEGADTHNDIEISCVILDALQKKFIAGSTEGDISVFNYSTGVLLKILDRHSSKVSSLHITKQDSLVSASWDGQIFIHSNLDMASFGTIKIPPKLVLSCPTQGAGDVSLTSYSSNLELLAACYADNTIRVWVPATASLDCIFKGHESDITDLTFLEPYPLVCSCDSNSCLLIWTVRPAVVKSQILCRFENYFMGSKMSPVYSVKYLNHHEFEEINEQTGENELVVYNNTLFTGDEMGEIKAWNLQNFFKYCNIQPVQIIKGKYKCETSKEDLREYKFLEAYQRPFLRFKWGAHHKVVTSMHFIKEKSVILSSSKDSRVRIWLFNGKYLGTLRQARFGGTWNMVSADPRDSAARLEKVEELLKEAKELEQKEPTTTNSSMPPDTFFERDIRDILNNVSKKDNVKKQDLKNKRLQRPQTVGVDRFGKPISRPQSSDVVPQRISRVPSEKKLERIARPKTATSKLDRHNREQDSLYEYLSKNDLVGSKKDAANRLLAALNSIS